MSVVSLNITFHEPFLIATGVPDEGLDVRVDRTNPLPGTALKGLIRAHARHWLGIREELVGAIFGSAAEPCPWVFQDAEVIEQNSDSCQTSLWNRIKVDADGQAEERAFVAGEQIWAETGTAQILWRGVGSPPDDHALVLRAAACDIVSIGSNRRRGFGWVSVTSDEPLTDAEILHLIELQEVAS